MLKIEHSVAGLPLRRPQQLQRLGMRIEEVGMPAQKKENVASADLDRRDSACTIPRARFRLILRAVGHDAQFPARRRGQRCETTTARSQKLIRNSHEAEHSAKRRGAPACCAPKIERV
ncbi:MAG TPA: hypothetical protein VM755_06980 [Stellaceae bacterium]|nr:hypothetical protein [Stellaceae bacterium]